MNDTDEGELSQQICNLGKLIEEPKGRNFIIIVDISIIGNGSDI
jgi:hypothetical protein